MFSRRDNDNRPFYEGFRVLKSGSLAIKKCKIYICYYDTFNFFKKSNLQNLIYKMN